MNDLTNLTKITVFGNEFNVGPGTEIPDADAIREVLTYLEVDPEVHTLTRNGTQLFITARTGSKGALPEELLAKLDSVKGGEKEVLFTDGFLVPVELLDLGFTVEEIGIAEQSDGKVVLTENMTDEEVDSAKALIAEVAKEIYLKTIRETLSLSESVTDSDIVRLAKAFKGL